MFIKTKILQRVDEMANINIVNSKTWSEEAIDTLTLKKKPKRPPVTSTNVEFGPKNFLTFSFNPFATLVQNFKFVPSANPKLLNLNQDHPSKKVIFPVKSL